MSPLLSLDELKNLPRTKTSPGLYFLWLRGNLQYVGMAKNVRSRMREHRKRLMFDMTTVLAIDIKDRDELRDIEAAYICRYQPQKNIVGTLARREEPRTLPARRAHDRSLDHLRHTFFDPDEAQPERKGTRLPSVRTKRDMMNLMIELDESTRSPEGSPLEGVTGKRARSCS